MRITLVSQTQQQVVLKVEGWVSGENVDVLEQEGNRRLAEAERVVLDLSGVKSISPEGVALLLRWSQKHLLLRGESPFVHMLLYHP